MRIDVLYLSILLAGCRTSIEGTGEIVDLGATETTFDTVATTQSPTATAESGAEPGIPTTSGGETGGGTGSGASSGAAPVCGDGVIEGDESCDDGIEANKNFNPCRADCQPATCGDGFVQVSNSETCDDGPLNTATPGYNECSTACVRATYCGDGIVQAEAGEECEPGGDDDADTCAAMCRHKPRLVFLTSAVYSGNLGGLAGADKRCNEFAAQQPGLTGSYRAWLLVDGQSLADRFPEFVAPATWNFTNTSAGLLAKSFTELIEEGPAEPVAFTEAGDAVPEAHHQGRHRGRRRLCAVDQRGREPRARGLQRLRARPRGGRPALAARASVDRQGSQAALRREAPDLLRSGRRLILRSSP